jgi:hypothetical protein
MNAPFITPALDDAMNEPTAHDQDEAAAVPTRALGY